MVLNQPPPPSQSQSPINVSVRLAIPVVDASLAPFYLAIDKGFFEKNGLNVKLEPGSPELNPVKMVSQGTDQFGILGGPELLFTARDKGAPLVAITKMHKDGNFVSIVSLKDSGITKVSDLEGKKVGFFYGHISTDILRMLFKKENIQVEEVDVGFDYSQFIAGKLPAQWAFRTTAGITLPAKGVELNFISPTDYGIETQGLIIVTTEQMIKEQPELVQKFINGVLEGMNYSVVHFQESINAILKRDPNFPTTVAEKQLEIYNSAITRNSPVGGIAEADMEQTKAQMLTVDLITADFDIKASFTTKFVEKFYQN